MVISAIFLRFLNFLNTRDFFLRFKHNDDDDSSSSSSSSSTSNISSSISSKLNTADSPYIVTAVVVANPKPVKLLQDQFVVIRVRSLLRSLLTSVVNSMSHLSHACPSAHLYLDEHRVKKKTKTVLS